MGLELFAQVSTGMAGLFLILGLVVGGAAVFGVLTLQARAKKSSAEQEAAKLIEQAQARGAEIRRAAEVETKATFLKRQEEFERQSAITKNEIREAEKRLDKREDQLERKLDTLNIKEKNIERAERFADLLGANHHAHIALPDQGMRRHRI